MELLKADKPAIFTECGDGNFLFQNSRFRQLSVCKVLYPASLGRKHVFYRPYAYTPPTGRTAFTEPQCLYKGALYLLCLHYRQCLIAHSSP